ncbi:hypothetical protein PC119_g4573 [Phytophthora cactorum]|nr:hypothetical protein PC114_g3247 [Phytophthora cactorum]KAG3035488.1 hypothetical protein PC119_g4573 [Phytophthora cactorum]
MRKEERIEALKRYDAAMTVYGEKLPGDGLQELPSNGDAIRNKHCMFRLSNILFSDEFALRFCRTATRAELDGNLINERSLFWDDVQAAFVDESPDNHERNMLELNDDNFFSGIDPKMAKKGHSAKKLFAMWKEVNKNYVNAEAKFVSSRQNENDFRNFVSGRGDVLYLRKWLLMRQYSHRVLFAKDEFDTLELATALSAQPKSTATVTPSKCRSNEALASMASSFDEYVMDRRDQAGCGSSSSMLQQRSQIIRMMADIRNQIANVDGNLCIVKTLSLQRP